MKTTLVIASGGPNRIIGYPKGKGLIKVLVQHLHLQEHYKNS